MQQELKYLDDIKKTNELIYSWIKFGSSARKELWDSASDTDTILVLNLKNENIYKEIRNIQEYIDKVCKEMNITKTDNVIVSKEEMFNILSVTMLLNTVCDGELITGVDIKKDFIKYINTLEIDIIYKSLLGTVLLKRHWFRKHILNMNGKSFEQKDLSFVAKQVIHRMRDFIRITKGLLYPSLEQTLNESLKEPFVKKHGEIVKTYYEYKQGTKVYPQTYREYEIYTKEAFNFCEKLIQDMIASYIEKTGDINLNIRNF